MKNKLLFIVDILLLAAFQPIQIILSFIEADY